MKNKILIVDDEPNVRFALRTRLAGLNCEVVEAGSLEDAKAILARERQSIGVVILDLKLISAQEEEGHESGLRLLKEQLVASQACLDCGSLQFNPQVIVLTAHPSVRSCREAFLAGALDYLGKNEPKVWELLLDRVEQALAQPRVDSLFTSRKWVENNFADLQQRYEGQTLAVLSGAVVAAAPTVDDLQKILEAMKLHPEDCFLVTISKE
jgi:DNA-binding NtrC family response regulator